MRVYQFPETLDQQDFNDLNTRLEHAEDALSEIARGEPAPHVVAENYFRNYNLTSLNYKEEL